MNRLAGIILAAIGFVIAVLSVVKIIPFKGMGVSLLLAGGLIIGLSFIERPNPDGTERMSTPSTLVNIFFSPGEVFRNLRRHPRWLAAIIIMTLMSAAYTDLFIHRLTPERVVNYSVDKTLEMSVVQNNPESKKQIEESRPKTIADLKDPVLVGGQAVTSFCWTLIGYTFLALVFFLFVMAMGGEINFFQALSVAIYASFPMLLIRFLLNVVLLYVKDPDDIHPIIGQTSLVQDNLNFLVLPADHPVIFSVLGILSLLWFYWAVLNAIGLRDAGEKVSSTTAWTVTLGIYGLMIVLSAAAGMLFGNFIS